MAEATAGSKQHLQSLERGIAVIQVFSHEHPSLTLSEVARLTGMTRATARRILLTLEKLGHVRSDGRRFSLTPRVLTLGWAYLSSLNLWEIAQPLMEDLVQETHESCSAATLDLPDIVYVARVPTRRIMTIALGVGTRLPAHATSMGRVLLADLPRGRARRLPVGVRARAVHPAHDRRSERPAGRRRRGPRAGLGARRSGARDRPALGGRADQGSERTDDRGAERLGCGPESLHRRAQKALPPGAPAHRGADLREPRPGVASGGTRLESRAPAAERDPAPQDSTTRGRGPPTCLC